MATKTISVTTEAYEMLRSWKENNESFSDVIVKIGKKNQLSDFAGLLSESEGRYLIERIKKGRELSRKRGLVSG